MDARVPFHYFGAPRNEKTRVTPQYSETVHRLRIAHEHTREAYEQTFRGHDLHPGTDIASAWPFITAAYSGIEQTFKFQIAKAQGKTVEELVATRRPKGEKGEARFPYRHHNLGTLFRCLDDPIRAALTEQYRRFRTLHAHIVPVTAAEFLDAVSAEDGRGYERWRYSLTAPEAKIPTNSAEALLSIWDTAVQLCETDGEACQIRGVYEQLTEGFERSLEEIMESFNVARIGRGVTYHDFRSEATEWLRAHGGVLNACSELVHRMHRGLMPDADADGLSLPFAECLTRWVQGGGTGAVKAPSDARVFLARAAGDRGPGRGVRWNGETNGFEDLPWELCETTADLPPEGAFRFEDKRGGSHRLQRMKWTLQQGFRVTENYPAREDMPVDKWLCTLCGEKTVEPGGKLTVRFWERREDRKGFYVEVEGAEDSKDGRLTREVLRLESESTRGRGAYIVEPHPDSKRFG